MTVLESCGKGLRANFALEVFPDERADGFAFGYSALLFSHPSFKAIEVDEPGGALAPTRVHQRVFGLVGAVQAHFASALIGIIGILRALAREIYITFSNRLRSF